MAISSPTAFSTRGATSGNAITKSVCYKGSNKWQSYHQKHLPQGEHQVATSSPTAFAKRRATSGNAITKSICHKWSNKWLCHHQKHLPQREQRVAMPSPKAFATRGATSGNAFTKSFAIRRATGVSVIIEPRPHSQLLHCSHSCCHHLSHPVTILATLQPLQPILHKRNGSQYRSYKEQKSQFIVK